ncbi:MAG TPA: hypothetical protein VLR92_08530 [Blastocatellia bacterium]|nr:hypothetical protein [Blastocatellia bacterium]
MIAVLNLLGGEAIITLKGEAFMIDERKRHLELVACGLTQAYYSVHSSGSPDHREVIETYLFLLEALVDHDEQQPGETPLSSGDPFEGN